MSELDYLIFQPIDLDDNNIPDEHRQDDDIALNEQIDESSLENYWKKVVEDIHQDPEWFTFADE